MYIPSTIQESILQTYTHIFSLEGKMVGILTDILEMKMRQWKHVAIISQDPVVFLHHAFINSRYGLLGMWPVWIIKYSKHYFIEMSINIQHENTRMETHMNYR